MNALALAAYAQSLGHDVAVWTDDYGRVDGFAIAKDNFWVVDRIGHPYEFTGGIGTDVLFTYQTPERVKSYLDTTYKASNPPYEALAQ